MFKRPDLFNFDDFSMKKFQSVLNNPEYANLKKEMEGMSGSQECKTSNKDAPSVESAVNTLVNRPNRTRNKKDNADEAATTPKEETKAIEVLRSKLRHVTERMRLYMYLTDNIERSIYDILPNQSPENADDAHRDLFQKAVDMDLNNFQLLYNLGIVNASRLAECIDYFREVEKRSESLTYTGIDRRQST